jgi:hypothetical protein
VSSQATLDLASIPERVQTEVHGKARPAEIVPVAIVTTGLDRYTKDADRPNKALPAGRMVHIC